MSPEAHAKTRRRLVALFSIPLAFSLVFFFVNAASERRETRMQQSEKLKDALEHLRGDARDAEAGERGFYLTGEKRFNAPYVQARQSLARSIRRTRGFASEQPQYNERVERIVGLVQLRFAEAEKGINMKASGKVGVDFPRLLIRSQDTTDEIRTEVRGLISELDAEQNSLMRTQYQFSQWSFAFFSIGSLLMIGVIVWLYNTLLRYLNERDAANEELKAANLHLEARIEERTRDLTQANEELQQFAYVASHDLQEPLRTITSFSQLLALRYQGRLDGDADEFIGYITSASRRMTDLINGLLALVRLRRTAQPTTPVSFEELIEQATSNLQALIRETGAIVEHGPLPSLVVDPVQFSQLIQNLVSNAIKYRGERLPRICVEASRDATNWTFSVEDNGSGFDPQYAERIFGLFQRLQAREVDGTGLGLAIARKIVERHGGRIWASSEPGVGSTFFFELPVSLESHRSPIPSEISDTAPAALP